MDDIANRRDSIANENIKSDGRPATNNFESWSSDVKGRIEHAFKDTKNLSDEEREERLKEMDEVVKEDLE